MPKPYRGLDPAEDGGWAIVLVCGGLWGIALAAIATLRQPPIGVPVSLLLEFMGRMLIVWGVNGVCWAILGRLAARGLAAMTMVAAWLVGTAALSAGQAAMIVTHAVLALGGGMRAVLGPDVPFEAIYAHVLWLNAVFGGLYLAGYWTFLRAMRSRRRLARLQLALNDETSRLQEARLVSLRGALRPETMLETVKVLRTRYETDPGAADALLDRLVSYLRAATGAPRSELTTDPAAHAYRALRAALSEPALALSRSQRT